MSLASALSGLSVDESCPPEDLSDSINRRFHDEAQRRSLSANDVLDKVRPSAHRPIPEPGVCVST